MSENHNGLHGVQAANYNTMKNKKNNPDRLEMNKYCRFCRKHTVHQGDKVSRRKKSMAEEKKKDSCPPVQHRHKVLPRLQGRD